MFVRSRGCAEAICPIHSGGQSCHGDQQLVVSAVRETICAIADSLGPEAKSVRVCIGPHVVEIRFGAPELASLLASAFAIRCDGRPAEYQLFATVGPGCRPLIVPQELDGDIHFLAKGNYYAIWTGRFMHALYAVDNELKRACYWIDRTDRVPPGEKARPFLPSFQAILHPTQWVAVHGAGIARNGKGILIAGRGSAGKTTLALAALRAGWNFVGDDFVLICPEERRMAPIYATARLRDDMRAEFEDFKPARREISTEGGEIRHELTLRMETAAAIVRSRIEYVVLLERSGAKQPTLSSVSRTAVIATIMETTTVVTPGNEAGRLQKLIQLVGSASLLKFDPGINNLESSLAALEQLVS